MNRILEIAEANQQKAFRIIRDLDIVGAWGAIGAEVHLVGSLKMGLLMKHRDIDLHIYSDPVVLRDGFQVMALLAEHPAVEKMEYLNGLHTEEACVEWHVGYRDDEAQLWQIDMIHICRGSRYDGYFERVAERIKSVLTDETRETILRLKYEAPEEVKICGMEYYRAVLEGGVRTFTEFELWREKHPCTGIIEWMP